MTIVTGKSTEIRLLNLQTSISGLILHQDQSKVHYLLYRREIADFEQKFC